MGTKIVKIASKRGAFQSFIAVILALLIVYGFYGGKIYVSILSLLGFGAILLYAIINKFKPLYVLLTIVFIFFLTYGFLTFNYIANIDIKPNTTYTVMGKVPTIINEGDKYISFVLEHCEIIETESGKSVLSNSKIRVISYSDFDVKAGDIIIFNDQLQKEELFSFGKINSFNLPSKIYATCFTRETFTIYDNKLELKDKTHLKIKEAFYSSMSTRSASLAYAVTFGDQSDISESVMDGFRYSGLAHILSVSGLHTTILFSLLAFGLARIPFTNKKITGVALAVMLLLYTYLCFFNPCIVRASIMCMVFYLTQIVPRKHDMLSSLGLSGLIVLLFNPLDLFNLGFCLSFGCMYGVAVLTKPISKLIAFIHNRFIISTIAMTLATQIATLPFMAYYFGYFSFISILANILLLPLFNFLFAILLILVIPSLIFTPSFLLGLIGEGMNIFIQLSVGISKIDTLIVPLCKIGVVGIMAYIVLTFITSNRFFVKWKKKCLISACLVVIIGLSIFFSYLPTTQLNTNYKVEECESTYYFKLNESNLCFVNSFKNGISLSCTTQKLNQINENKIENMILISKVNVDREKLQDFFAQYKISNIYLPKYLYEEDSALIQLLETNSNLILMEDMDNINIGTDAKFIRSTESKCYIKYIIKGNQFIVTNS